MQFTDRQLEFLEKELGISREKAAALTEEELLEIQDRCFDIELEGDLSSGSKMPDRCGIASDLVSLITENL